jgi:hypothetical protein
MCVLPHDGKIEVGKTSIPPFLVLLLRAAPQIDIVKGIAV